MGFSVSGATAVVFLGLLVSASVLYPTIDRSQERRHEAVEAREERSLTRQNTDLVLHDATYNNTSDVLTVTVENIGAESLDTTAVDLLVDGVLADATTSVGGDSGRTTWASGTNLTLTVDPVSGDGVPARVKVVSGPGIAVTGDVTEVN